MTNSYLVYLWGEIRRVENILFELGFISLLEEYTLEYPDAASISEAVFEYNAEKEELERMITDTMGESNE
jgi:hypothetical protein